MLLLILIEMHYQSSRSTSIVIGMLKVGKKHLYLMNGAQDKFEEEPMCILDFYVHDSVQRKGNGHHLFDHMLKVSITSQASVVS